MKMSMFRSLCAAALFALVSNVQAATLVDETFSYPDGSLVPNGGWVNHSGTLGDLLVSGGQAVVEHGAPSEDAHLIFGAVSTGVLTADFDIVVNDDSVIAGNDFEYFAHFMLDGSFNFGARLDIVAPTDAASGDFTLGIATTSSTAESTLPTDFSFGQSIPVSLSFDFDAGLASVTAGGNTATSTSVFLGETYDSFALRQSDSSNNESIMVDNLIVSGTLDVPEPASIALALLGVVAIGARRRNG
ncbi:PEP-CTERM motif protein [Posidoniimonas polymericola]|uniref:PEP-CTERM motif protein n=1 Tax=Posidoniimonas polymericola TaxID=2528002 RepID=A0A5C5YGI3_9BACT|nr:PEP-CTERM sorting domain-containing protein [Posidoniimonas polymericola]TWT73651.1 PEP-CTERM motif protein [Posidoniimonas polymericola]